jgi:hypothetical protein
LTTMCFILLMNIMCIWYLWVERKNIRN